MREVDSRFEDEIVEYLKDIVPPEEELKNINPWSRPIGLISWGLVLSLINLNFLFLQYILPTIGIALIFLGFRSLRNENRHFKTLWIISIGKLIGQFISLLWISTPLNTLDHYLRIPLGLMWGIVHIVMFLIFHRAIEEVYARSGRTMEKSPLLQGALWIFLVMIIAISPLSSSWLTFVPMLIFYIQIIRSILALGKQLDSIGYELVNAPVRINNRTFGWGYFLISFIIALGLNAFFNHYRLEGKVFIAPENTGVREDLVARGFPREALRYLGEEDIDLLRDAVNIEAISELFMYDPGQVEKKEITEYKTTIEVTEEPGKKNLESTTIYIEMPEDILYIMQYFKWQGGRPIWQEGISVWGGDDEIDKEIIKTGLFYSKKDVEYLADFPLVKMEEIERQSFFGRESLRPIMGSFSFPLASRDQGGYILFKYRVDGDEGLYIRANVFEYFHGISPVRLPFKGIEDRISSGSFGFSSNYKQQYTTYDSLKVRDLEE